MDTFNAAKIVTTKRQKKPDVKTWLDDALIRSPEYRNLWGWGIENSIFSEWYSLAVVKQKETEEEEEEEEEEETRRRKYRIEENL